VEIDLAQQGASYSAGHSKCPPASGLAAGLRRSVSAAEEHEVYPIRLRERLPGIRVPRPTDADVVLDLQPLIDQCHERPSAICNYQLNSIRRFRPKTPPGQTSPSQHDLLKVRKIGRLAAAPTVRIRPPCHNGQRRVALRPTRRRAGHELRSLLRRLVSPGRSDGADGAVARFVGRSPLAQDRAAGGSLAPHCLAIPASALLQEEQGVCSRIELARHEHSDFAATGPRCAQEHVAGRRKAGSESNA
jgi:hypothetical protein